ncbi:MAG: dTDP-4-dehydrorhamnose reductase [bacterium]
MRVLIIGAGGMLGGTLCKAFEDQEIICWGKEDIDITDEMMVREKIAGGVDLLINAAAYTDVDGAETNKELAFAVNELGVKNLAGAAAEAGARLVHYSTDYVFAGDSKEGYEEDDEPGPAVNVYGESKLAGERALAAASDRTGLEFYLIRTAWLYGVGGKNFVDTMLKLAQEKDSLSVIDDQYGSPTCTQDVAEATRRIVMGEYRPGVYHAVNSGTTTWYGLAREVFKQRGVDTEVKPIITDQYLLPARRPKYSILRDTKGLNMRLWQEALKDYLDNRG